MKNAYKVALLAAFVALLMAMGSSAIAKKDDTAFKLDVAAANSFLTPAGETTNQGNVSILKGNADGTFAKPGKFAFSRPVNLDVGDAPVAVVRGDYNVDSKPDLAVANIGNEADPANVHTLSVLINATTKGGIGVGGSDSENGLFRAIEDGSDGILQSLYLKYGSPGGMIIQRSRKPGGRQGCARIQLISVRSRGALPHSPAVKQSLPPLTRGVAVWQRELRMKVKEYESGGSGKPSRGCRGTGARR